MELKSPNVSLNPKSGNFSNNLPLPGARLEVYATDPATGDRRGTAAYSKTIGADGAWGPFAAQPATPYEFVIAAPGYATTHVYRSPFPRSSTIVHLKPERIANFLLLKPEFPYSVRHSLDRMHEALTSISNLSLSRRTEQIERLIGRLRSMVSSQRCRSS